MTATAISQPVPDRSGANKQPAPTPMVSVSIIADPERWPELAKTRLFIYDIIIFMYGPPRTFLQGHMEAVAAIPTHVSARGAVDLAR